MNPYAPPTAQLRLEPREWPWTGLTWLEFFLAVVLAWLIGQSLGQAFAMLFFRVNA